MHRAERGVEQDAADGATFARVGEVFLGKDRSPLPEAPRLIVACDMFDLAVPEAGRILGDVVNRLALSLGDMAEARLAKDIDALYWAFRWLQGREAWLADGEMISRFAPPLGPGVAERFAFARTVTDEQVEAGQRTRTAFRKTVRELLGKDGVIVMPTVSSSAMSKSTVSIVSAPGA
jgi:amidase